MKSTWVLFLLALTFLYRLAFLLLIPRALDNADAIHYAEAARQFAAADFYSHDPKIPLLYPLLSAIPSAIIGDPEWGCRMLSFLFSCLTIFPVYGIALRLHGRRAAWWSGVIFALWPWLADYACAVATEALAVFLWLSGFWCLLQWRRWRYAAPALTGLAYAALYLTRAEGMLIALAALPAAGLVIRRPRLRAVHWCWVYGATLVAAFVAASLYNRGLTGAANPNVRVGYIVQEFDFLRFAQTAADTLTDVIPLMLGPVLLALLGIGLFAPRPHRRTNEELALLLLSFVQLIASWFVLSPAPRYLMSPLVALTLWSAAGLVLLQNWILTNPTLSLKADEPSALPLSPLTGETAGVRRQLLAILPALALLAFFAIGAARTIAGEYLSDRPRQPIEYKEAGLWMRDNLKPGLIFTRKPQVAFYASMPSTGPLDSDTLDQAIARAREAKAKYLVVDERYAPPALLPLLDSTPPTNLELLQSFTQIPRARVKVFALH